MRTRILAVIGLAVFTGCAAPTAGAKLQEASQELNINARFGRMEMAVERVAAKNREQWLRNHRGWGGKIRVVDVETAGTRMASSAKEAEAEVTVRVSWFRMEDQDLKLTTLRQKGQGQLVYNADEFRWGGSSRSSATTACCASSRSCADAGTTPRR